MAKVTLQHVAEKAGVSTALVSYVVNGQKKGRVSKDATERIQAAIKELGYRPNYLAQSFKRKRTFNIGLIVADIANPFSAQLARIISNAAEHDGYTLTIGSSDENLEKFEKLVNLSLDRQVDGFILAAPEGAEHVLLQLQQQGIPFVLVDRYFPSVTANSITTQNYEASYEAVKKFIAFGRTQVGIISYDTSLQHLNERVRGASDAIQSANRPPDTYIKYIVESNMELQMPIIIRKMIETGVNAFFFTSNKLGIAGLKQLTAYQVSVPMDVSFTTFDGSEAFSFYPGDIGYIRQPLDDMGNTAFALLLRKIAEPDMAAEQLVLPTRFMVTSLYNSVVTD